MSDDPHVVRVGDRMRFYFELLHQILEEREGLSEVLEVKQIDIEPGGEKVIWMQKAPTLQGAD